MTNPREYPTPADRLGARNWIKEELSLFHAYADPLLDEIERLKALLIDQENVQEDTVNDCNRLLAELRATIERQRGVMRQASDALRHGAGRDKRNKAAIALQAELKEKKE